MRVRHLFTLTSLALSAFFVWLFYERYWKYRDCIEAAKSSCITPDGANLTGGGIFWIGFAVLFGLLAVGSCWTGRRR